MPLPALPRQILVLLIVALWWLAAPVAGSSERLATDPIELQMVPVKIDGTQFKLATRIFRPVGEPPFPTVVFHHGSTGYGRNPKLFPRHTPQLSISEFFTERGWAVVLPSRRGRGGSEGRYDEGFHTDRKRGYSCTPTAASQGFEHALADVDAVTAAIRNLPFVDPERLVVGGQSRGGILAAVHAAKHPSWYQGVISFAGGWVGESKRCRKAATINQQLFARAAPYPHEIIWLHGPRDPVYSNRHVKANFAAFEDAGGSGTLARDFPKGPGHYLKVAIDLFAAPLDAYLARRGLPHAVLDPANALALSPDPDTPPSAFLGTWKGRWENGTPITVSIEKVKKRYVEGSYTFAKRTMKFSRPVKNGFFTVRNKAKKRYTDFFVASENAMRLRFRSRQFHSRAILIRTPG